MIKKGVAVLECELCGYRETEKLPVYLGKRECGHCSGDTFYIVGIEDEVDEIIKELSSPGPDLRDIQNKWQLKAVDVGVGRLRPGVIRDTIK